MTMLEQLEQLALEPGPANRLILADWHEERGNIKEMAAWRWMAEREPVDFTDYSERAGTAWNKHNLWIWLRSEENQCRYREHAEEWKKQEWEKALIPPALFHRVSGTDLEYGIGAWGLPIYSDTVKALYHAYLETL